MFIPEYWKPHLEEKINKISALKNAAQDCLCFALITDIHWTYSAQHSGALLTKVMQTCDIPFFFNAGDTFVGLPFCSREFIFQNIKDYRKAFKKIEDRCLMVMGNHDAAYTTKLDISACYNENISLKEVAKHYFGFLKKYPNRVFGGDTYYYVDDNEQKCRYIVLNTHDIPSDEKDENGFAKYNSFRLFCIRQAQLEWFAHTALNVPSKEWSVVLCSHENPNAQTKKHITHNNPILVGVINAFQNSTSFSMKTRFDDEPFCDAEISVDFTNRGGNFVAWLGGHEHRDILQTIDDIVCITTCNDATGLDGQSIPFHVWGTDKEHSFDVFIIDKQQRKGDIVRIGYGNDRTFTY